MCGRYQFSLHQFQELRTILCCAQKRNHQFNELRLSAADPSGVPSRGAVTDICPSDVAPVMVARGGEVVAEFQQWGFPNWQGKRIINARAETVTEKPMFRRSIAAQRCVIPASSYYEWNEYKQKYRFHRPEQPLYFAGIYDTKDGIDRFLILTTAPNDSVKPIHDRMPLILTHDQVRPWLTDDMAAMELLTGKPPILEKECCDAQLSMMDFS